MAPLIACLDSRFTAVSAGRSSLLKCGGRPANGQALSPSGSANAGYSLDCREVMYLQQRSVTLSVLSSSGKAAIVSVLQPGDFFGEGCLAGLAVRMSVVLHDRPRLVRIWASAGSSSQRFDRLHALQ